MSEKADEQVTFWDHLDDLRKVLINIAGTLLVLAIGLFTIMRFLFDQVIFAPTRNDFILYQWIHSFSNHFPLIPQSFLGNFEVNIININLTSQFFYHISTSFWMALVLGFPFIMYQLFVYIRPALYQHEKRNVGLAFIFGNFLFYLGIAVGYFIVFPLTLRFLAGYEISSAIENSVSLDSYMNNFLLLCFIMGLIFELPLLSWLLSKLGLLHREFFRKYQKKAIIVLLLFTAFITPTGDPFTLMLVFIPIYMLWEVSALLVKKEISASDNP